MAVFRADDGTEIAYKVWEGDAALPPVLLHHGFIASGATNWEVPGIVAALTGAGRRVVTVDARGHGASGKPHDPASYGEARMARDVTALLDLLGADRVDLVGYSMGAVVALLTAVRDRRVRRLVVGGVGCGVPECGGVDSRVLDGPALRHALTTDDPGTVTDPTAAAFRAFVDAAGGDRIALAAQAAAAHAEPIGLDRITAPTLVLAGREDPLAARPEVLAAAVPGAVLRLVEGDHVGALRDPAFTERLVGFLGGDGTGRG
ncbi:alpha/beta hydrolase [Streptomyces sp. CRN 30]|uniref:alpha/beta fold hydrolase n=1 Tax=Streptomyces sp. CRN 30 TaxID=3075613 RepID=UPI002A807DC6|nr:alpha/beta hydrolase [Streptomyces sp. CRN 30]